MNRKQLIATSTVAALLAVAVLVLLGVNRREALKSAIPAWLQTTQPPDGVAADLPTLTDGESWAANRCRPMAGSCGDNTAGRRIRREYPASLAEMSGSFIRASFDLSGGV